MYICAQVLKIVVFFVFFLEWLNETGHPEAFEELPPSEIDQLLGLFYAAAGPTDKAKNTHYSKSTYINLRAGINRYLRLPPYNRKLNVMKDDTFQRSNKILIGILKKLRKEG